MLEVVDNKNGRSRNTLENFKTSSKKFSGAWVFGVFLWFGDFLFVFNLAKDIY